MRRCAVRTRKCGGVKKWLGGGGGGGDRSVVRFRRRKRMIYIGKRKIRMKNDEALFIVIINTRVSHTWLLFFSSCRCVLTISSFLLISPPGTSTSCCGLSARDAWRRPSTSAAASSSRKSGATTAWLPPSIPTSPPPFEGLLHTDLCVTHSRTTRLHLHK